MDMTGVQLHEKVRVFDVNGKRKGQPEGGWEGEVTRVGRTLFDVTFSYANGSRRQTLTFTKESGRTNDKYGHQYVQTSARVRGKPSGAVRRSRSSAAPGSPTAAPGSTPEISTTLLEAIAMVIETYGQDGWAGEPDVQTLLGETHSQSISGNWSF